MSEEQMGDAALAFRDLCVYSDGKVLLHSITGLVPRGGITAVLGPSASGKSVLLQTLSARIQVLPVTGQVYMDGRKVNPKSRSNPVAYVPQEDSLVGEFTAREVTLISAVLKRAELSESLRREVADLMTKMGLAHVADGIIGTLVFRGLSGGQKKRVEVSTELIASPSVLLLDEPTSGLDSSVAFDVLGEVRSLVKASEGRLSVLLSIHQPNSRILGLFDNIILIDQGASIFSGTLPEASAYFSRLGFDCPSSVTPTDYFLKISDSNFNYSENFDFEEAYLKSAERATLLSRVDRAMDAAGQTFAGADKPTRNVSFLYKFYTLVHREYALAFRDPTLYYFQVNLMYAFGFMTGAVFFKLPLGIDANINQIFGSILWFSLMNGWVHAFKVYHITSTDRRTRHEVSNNKYSALTFCAADAFTSATLGVLFFPTVAIAYVMIDYPQSAFPFLLLNYWMTSMASEAMLSFICKFSENPTTSMVICQIVLSNTMVFGAGVFLPWKDCPDYWIWVQEMSLFTQSSRAAVMEIFNEIQFVCGTVIGGNICVNTGNGDTFPCSTPEVNGKCLVDGRAFLQITQGIGRSDSHWYYFAYLCAIFLVFKLFVFLLTAHPWANVYYSCMRLFAKEGDVSDLIEERNRARTQSLSTPKISSTQLSAAQQSPSASLLRPSLTWTQLSVILPKGDKVLIEDVSGHVSSGRVLALMGPSGAGKTTLLNALARKANYAKISGQILFAGRAMSPTDLTYVPQFDQINGVLTVEEHLTLVGKLTCVDVSEMLERLEILLSILGLTAKRHTQVKNLTGGEVKRVSIGIGLISKPNVLFLDEPTTGLDSTAAFAIVNYLSEIAITMNIAVILTIHQPSALVFDLLDDLLLLEGGRIVYGGCIEDAATFFAESGYSNPERINPADYYLDLVQRPPASDEDLKWCDLFAAHKSGSRFIAHIDSVLEATLSKDAHIQPSAAMRFSTMLRYFLFYFIRERGFYVHRLVALIIIGVFIGTLYLGLEPTTGNIVKYIGAMFFTIVSVMLTAVSSTALLAKDRGEAVDRVGNGIFTPAVYVAAQFLASLVYCLPLSFIFMCIFYQLVNINPNSEAFVYFWMMCWVSMALMEAVLLNFIEAIKNAFLCTTSAMIFLGSIMAFSGFFRAVNDMVPWASWLCYILPLKYIFDGLATQLFHTQTFQVSGSNPVVSLSGDSILKATFNLEGVNSWGMWGVAIAYLVLLRFNQYLLFAYQTGTLFSTLPAVGTIHKATISRSKSFMGNGDKLDLSELQRSI